MPLVLLLLLLGSRTLAPMEGTGMKPDFGLGKPALP